LIDDDSKIIFELFLFATKIKKEVCGVLESILSKKNYEKNKSHNMLCLMLDPILKTFG
jgi:hypothetical protein